MKRGREKSRKEKPKKKKIVWLILLLILLFFFWIILPETGNKAGEEDGAAMEACEQFLDAYKKADVETVTRLLAGTGYASGTVKMEGYPEIVGKELQYTVKTPEEEEDGRCLIPVEIVSLDLPEMAEDEEFLSRIEKDDLLEVLQEYLEDQKAPTTQYELSVQMRQEDGTWKVLMDDAFSNALLGGFGEFYFQMTEEMAGEQE